MITRTLICLVSDQRLQNIIPLQQRGETYDRVVFMLSGKRDATYEFRVDPRFERIANMTVDALRMLYADRGVRLDTHIEREHVLDDADITKAQAACLKVILREQEHGIVVMNFTGGTKPMSIGAYQAAKACSCETLYVNTAASCMHRQRSLETIETPFDLHPITVLATLAAQGREVNKKVTRNKALTPPEVRLGEWIFEHRSEKSVLQATQLHNVMFGTLRGRRLPEEQRVPISTGRACRPLLLTLIVCGFAIQRDGSFFLTKPGAEFMDGRWLEAYIFAAVDTARVVRGLMDVQANVALMRPDNELDVGIVVRGGLRIVECKIGSKNTLKVMDVMSRLEALRELCGGTFGRGYLVMAHEVKPESELMVRASAYGIKVIPLGDLDKVHELLTT